jgi:cation transport regulator ChaC
MAGYVENYVRRFWQSSSDHRGTPENPGRVVTLISHEEHDQYFKHQDPHQPCQKVYGILYKIHPNDVESVLDHLDYREKDGYSLKKVNVTLLSGEVIENACLYVASRLNSSFLGPASSITEIAKHIATSEGPSGRNVEYLLNLCTALKEIANYEDPHLKALEEKVSEFGKFK